MKLLSELRLISIWRIALPLLLVAVASCALLSQVTQEREKHEKHLNEDVQNKIAQKLKDQGSDSNAVWVFDSKGDFKKELMVVPQDALTQYKSLTDFVSKRPGPGETCKNPKPVPPPPCVVCADGTVLCSKAKFTGRQPAVNDKAKP